MTANERVPDGKLCFVVEPMTLDDVPAVLAVERASFSSPWPARAYRYEITRNDHSHYFVLRCQDPSSDGDDIPQVGEQSEGNLLLGLFSRLRQDLHVETQTTGIAGYGGLWISGYRGHVSTLAVAPQWRQRGLGKLLLLHMVDCAASRNAKHVTLEVRATNDVAQNLYRKCGFAPVGVEKGYYRDNGEDALLMQTPSLTDPAYRTRLDGLWAELMDSLDHSIVRKTR